MTAMDDYLNIGSLIAARLRDQFPDIPVIEQWMANEREEPKVPVIIWVEIEADNPMAAVEMHGRNQVYQTWAVVVVCRKPNTNAGVTIGRMITALSGWSPGEMYDPLKRVQSTYKSEAIQTGTFYFPLAFQTDFFFPPLNV